VWALAPERRSLSALRAAEPRQLSKTLAGGRAAAIVQYSSRRQSRQKLSKLRLSFHYGEVVVIDTFGAFGGASLGQAAQFNVVVSG
jgi:hypothetical protein